MNTPILKQFLTHMPESNYSQSKWPEILIAQHAQLGSEITVVTMLLAQDRCRLLQLDAKFNKLLKGVLIHLELEACFLTPALDSYKLSNQQQENLNLGFLALQETCHATIHYLHSLKLTLGNSPVKAEHTIHFMRLLNDIRTRLDNENIVYSILTKAG